ncbi:MAG: glutamine synthetase [Anaplasma sp.]
MYHQEPLDGVLTRLQREFRVCPSVGVEVEFYVKDVAEDMLDELFSEFVRCVNSSQCNVTKEVHKFQYELSIAHSRNIESILADLTRAKELLLNSAKGFDGTLDFSAKPYIDAPGSAFHVHVNLVDQNSKNLFVGQDGKKSDILLHCVGGLCACMRAHMVFFAPHDRSYLRYVHADHNTPTTVSWGGNNRSTAIRLPDTHLSPENTRIEHRVPGADCDYRSAITAILIGMSTGIEHKIAPPHRTFGIASDPQYRLEKLPLSLQEAEKLNLHSYTSSSKPS